MFDGAEAKEIIEKMKPSLELEYRRFAWAISMIHAKS